MRAIVILSLASLLFSGALKAQEDKKDYPRTALYVEVGGRNFLFGVAADFLLTKKKIKCRYKYLSIWFTEYYVSLFNWKWQFKI
jgi:hypothetical protein